MISGATGETVGAGQIFARKILSGDLAVDFLDYKPMSSQVARPQAVEASRLAQNYKDREREGRLGERLSNTS